MPAPIRSASAGVIAIVSEPSPEVTATWIAPFFRETAIPPIVARFVPIAWCNASKAAGAESDTLALLIFHRPTTGLDGSSQGRTVGGGTLGAKRSGAPKGLIFLCAAARGMALSQGMKIQL